tara:strand:- start:104 stop:832 length:729 start_codon:yes stop_codon:yes gene_type:complete
MVNPHWDEEITEDIGFKGPHFNESIQETWSPQGEFGQHGEFTGWKSQEDPPSYRSDWQNYPADEFTGIQSNVPSGGGFLRNIFEKFGGNRVRPGGGFETPYGGGNLNQVVPLFNPEPGPWNEFNPSDLPHSLYPGFDDEVTSEDLLAKIYTSDMPGMQDPGTNLGFFSSDNFFDQLTLQGKAINDALDTLNSHGLDLQGLLDQGYSRDAIYDMIPASIKQNLPRDAFETISDFRGQQPITVI